MNQSLLLSNRHMSGHKHCRFLSLQKVPKVMPSEPPDSLNSSATRDVMLVDLEDTPKMITCAMQPLSSVLLDIELPSPVANEGNSSTRPLTLDDFLNSTHSRVFNRSIRKIPIKRRILGRMKEMMSPAGPVFREYKRLASEKEVTKEERRKAAICIQRWYRQRLTARQSRDKITVNALTRIRQKIAARVISTAIQRFASHRKALKLTLSRKFASLCVVLIQKTWRGHHARMAFRTTLFRRYVRATAAIKGWKCRRILRLPHIIDLKQRIRTTKSLDIRLVLRKELTHQMRIQWANGEWLKRLTASSPGKRLKVRTTSVETEPQTDVSSPGIAHNIGRRNRQYKSGFPASICKTEGSVASTEDNFSPLIPPKPFLKRKSSKISGRKVDWADVKSRVQCWSTPPDPSVINTSLQEFLHLEKAVSHDDTISVDKQRAFATPGKTYRGEDSADTERKPGKSCIPRVSDCSGFIVSLKRIDNMKVMTEIRELLQKEFEVLQ